MDLLNPVARSYRRAVDARAAPPVTISDGTGRTLSGSRELLGEEQEHPRGGPRPGRHRLGGLALAAAAGFTLATVLADLRTTTLEESAEGVLSLDVRLESSIRPHLATDADGGRSLATSVVIRNTGPRTVALERAELLGTSYRSDDLRGRRVAAGEESVVVLLRRIDCSRLGRGAPAGPLRVHATTGAGRRSVDHRVIAGVLESHDEQVRAACGRSAADDALYVQDSRESLDGATMVLDLTLRNGSSRPLSVERLVPATGLRIVGVTSHRGTPVALPLQLEPGDFDPPVDPFFGGGPATELSVRLAVEDCARFEPASSYAGGSAVSLWVTDGRYGHPYGGDDPETQQRLHDAACGSSS